MNKPPPDPTTCASCKYFTPDKGDDVGECRRYPPTPITLDEKAACIRPEMNRADWCGEYVRLTH